MNHPYEEYENSKLWEVIESTLNDLVENQDIELKTHPEYVVGYLCKKIKTEKIDMQHDFCNLTFSCVYGYKIIK